MGSAGFGDTNDEPAHHDLVLGEDLESATDFSLEAGPVARLLLNADDEVRADVRAAVMKALAPYAGPHGVRLRAATWIVRSRR
jgi:hypothetical protein